MKKQLKTKILSQCPSCNSSIKRLYNGSPDRLLTTNITYAIDQCLKCSLAFTNPMPSGNLDILYPQQYLSSDTSSKFVKKYREDQYRYDFNLFVKATGLPLNTLPSYLDVGCGNGTRLTLAQQLRVKKVKGIDRYEYKNTTIPKNMYIKTLIEEYKPSQKFHLVSLFHVLEHLDRPQYHLNYIAKHFVARGGYLMIQVPNFSCWERYLFQEKWFLLETPRHYWHFTPHLIEKWLIAANLKIINTYQLNAPLHPISFTISLIPDTDPRRAQLQNTRSPLYWKSMFALFGVGTLATIPLNVLVNGLNNSSLLTIIAKKPA